MIKILHVAVREFLATAVTKAFLIGAFVIPLLILVVMAILFPLLLKQRAPAVEGVLALADRSGRVADDLRERLAPEAIAARQRELAGEVAERVEESLGGVGRGVGERLVDAQEEVPRITVVALAPAADVEAEKQPLRAEPAEGQPGRLALAVIDPNAVEPDSSGGYGGFTLYVRADLDDRVASEMRSALEVSIRQERMVAAHLDPERMRALTDVRAPRTVEVTAAGERRSLGEARVMVSFGFIVILMISVMIGGQYLLTTTVEEKSSRVVEVLLSALSPFELMAGKILGQLGVSFVILAVYGALGGGALVLWNLADLLGVATAAYLVVFFFIAYVTMGACMAAIGSAVNDIREAQSLQGPVMIAMLFPYMLWLPISRDPNSLFATVTSLLPPISPFVMMLRVTSTEPPPAWQVWLSIVLGLAGVAVAVWAAAKIFRIGLLMFGKPPNFLTLLRWVRMS